MTYGEEKNQEIEELKNSLERALKATLAISKKLETKLEDHWFNSDTELACLRVQDAVPHLITNLNERYALDIKE